MKSYEQGSNLRNGLTGRALARAQVGLSMVELLKTRNCMAATASKVTGM